MERGGEGVPGMRAGGWAEVVVSAIGRRGRAAERGDGEDKDGAAREKGGGGGRGRS